MLRYEASATYETGFFNLQHYSGFKKIETNSRTVRTEKYQPLLYKKIKERSQS